MEFTYRNCWKFDEIKAQDGITPDMIIAASTKEDPKVCNKDVGDDPNIAIERCYCITQEGDSPCNSGLNLTASFFLIIALAFFSRF